MFKKIIEFEDFNGNKISQAFYFHMSKAEFLGMAADGNTMLLRLQRIIADQDGKAILKEFRDLIEASCGMRSEDGSRFLKTPEAKSALLDSPAYDELLMELCTSADAGTKFVQELMPDKMQKEMQEQLKKQGKTDVETIDPFKQPAVDDPRPVWMKEERNPTEQELLGMSQDELRMAFRYRK